jgi:NitT/TauT family transport system substrate-binding protein
MTWAVATEKGYFAEEGLDVAVLDGNASATTVGLVSQDPSILGLVDGSVLIRSVAQDLPLKAVFGLYQTSPLSIFVRRESGITTPKDLEGKRLAGTAGGGSEVMFPFWMRQNGADPDLVEIVSLDPAARNQAFIDGTVDGAFNFITEIGTYAAAGIDAVALRYADYGINVPSVSVVVNTRAIEERPEVIQGFVRAYQRGLADVEADPTGSLDALVKHGPETLRREVLEAQWEVGKELLRTERTEDEPVGYMSPEDWQEGIDVIAGLGDLQRVPTVDELITNEFIPGA